MEDTRCFLMIPLPLSDSFISYPIQSMELGPVCCPLFVVTTGDSFQEHYAATKPLFSLALFSLFNCPCPQADGVLLALLFLSPLTQLLSAERRHLSDRAIVSRPAHCLLLSLTVMRFDQMCFSNPTCQLSAQQSTAPHLFCKSFFFLWSCPCSYYGVINEAVV